MSFDRARDIACLRDRIERLEHACPGGESGRATLPFGLDPIDSALPGRGLRLGAVHEVVPNSSDLSDAAACTLFVAGILARLDGQVLWCMPSKAPFPPALAGAGLRAERVLYAEPSRDAALLPLVEEGARFGGLVAVVAEVAKIGLVATRRLQLAAEGSGATVFLLRRLGRRPTAVFAASAAASRWKVGARPSVPGSHPGFGRARWCVDLERCRGAPAGTAASSWVLEACDEAGRLALPADLADRPHPQARSYGAAAG
ncbi:ImuA family protein [Methylobacterium brachythecii]|uniref:ImuA family protein n=1 Tax=Methylobacterium brachythecii TaxID=1176177 RepID=UPI0024E07373|nr:damage-inducible mutagenesis protein [Methylobacterium brachythecii]